MHVYYMKRSTTIGFDARYAPIEGSSRGSYARQLIAALAEAAPRRSYLRMYVAQSGTCRELERLAERHNVEVMAPDGSLWRKLKSLWRTWPIVRDLGRGDVELFHSLDASLPFGLARRNIRSVVTVHSLDFLAVASLYNPLMSLYRRLMLASAVHRADRVIAVSECVKRDIVRHFGIDSDKVDVIYRPCHPRFAAPIDAERLASTAACRLLPKRYILTVGTKGAKQNVVTIIESLQKLPSDLHLVIVGRATKYAKHLRHRAKLLGMEHRVHLLHDVEREEMPAIYRLATAYVHLARYEGFATPIVEALTVGVPVVAARGSSLEEAGGASSIYIEANDRSALVRSIEGILLDEELRSEMISGGREHVSRFRPEVMAYNVMNCYRRIDVDIAE